jgi:hypothetical protein
VAKIDIIVFKTIKFKKNKTYFKRKKGKEGERRVPPGRKGVDDGLGDVIGAQDVVRALNLLHLSKKFI